MRIGAEVKENKIKFMLYFIGTFCKHCILLSRVTLVTLSTIMHYTPLKLFFMDTCIIPIYSSVDHDQMAFGIQKKDKSGFHKASLLSLLLERVHR